MIKGRVICYILLRPAQTMKFSAMAGRSGGHSLLFCLPAGFCVLIGGEEASQTLPFRSVIIWAILK